MRVLGDLRLPFDHECVGPLTWLHPGRLLAVVRRSNDTEIVLIDPAARRVLRREPLPSGSWATARTRDELVVLLGTDDSFAPARIAVVDAEAKLRMATVERVLAGTVVDEQGEDLHAQTISPGLAIDPDGRRAFLVPASGPIAEVDLQTLDVGYHELDRPSLFGRFLRWLEPVAEAKAIEGPVRNARWLGDGILAVSGMDYSIASDARGELIEIGRPAGLSLIDMHSWTTRMLSREASSLTTAPGMVIASGGGWNGQDVYGPGLLAFGLDGNEMWRLHSGKQSWIDAAGSVGYVYPAPGIAEVVDLATGRVLRTIKRHERQNPWPQLLVTQASSW